MIFYYITTLYYILFIFSEILEKVVNVLEEVHEILERAVKAFKEDSEVHEKDT